MNQTIRQHSLTNRIDDSGVPLLLARLIVGGMFVYLAYKKIMDPVAFLKNINEYRMLEPGAVMNAIAIMVPWIELVAGLALLLGVMVRGAALTAAGMLAVFTPAIVFRAISMLDSGVDFTALKFDCGCGSGEVLIWKKLLENSGLFIASLVALFSRSRRFCLSALFSSNQRDAAMGDAVATE